MVEDIVKLLSVSYSGTKEERSEATARLEAALQSQDAIKYLLVLLQTGTNPGTAQDLGMLALICAKNYVVRDMDEGIAQKYPQDFEQVKHILFSAALAMPHAQRKVLHPCIATIVSAFSWNFLDDLVPRVLDTCQKAEQRPLGVGSQNGDTTVSAQLELLYVAAKRFKTKGLMPEKLKLDVCRAIVQPLSALLALEDMDIFHMLFKLVECILESLAALPSGTPVSSVAPPEVIASWFQVMSQFPQQYHNAACTARSASPRSYMVYVKCVKRIAVISYSLLNDATRRQKPSEICSFFLREWGAPFLQMWKQWLTYCITSNDREAQRKSEMFAIRFIKMSCIDKTLYTQLIMPDALGIVENLMFPYLCYNSDDEEVFADEEGLAEFVRYMMEESVGSGELSQRQAASNAILTLLGGKRSFHDQNLLPRILLVIQQGLTTPDTEDCFARSFGFLHLLSILRKPIREMSGVWNTQVSTVLINYVLPRAMPTSPHVALRTKAIVVLQRYSKVPFASEGDFQRFIEVMCSFVADRDVRVRLSGIDAMCTLLEIGRARQYLRPILVPLVEESLYLMEKVHTTYIPTVILYLTEHFSPELTTVLDKLAAGIVRQFMAAAFDLEAGEATADGAPDENQIQRFEQTALSAVALLDSLFTVVTASYRNPTAFLNMRPDVLCLVRRVLETPDNYDFVETTLSILLHVISFSKPIPQECWDILPLLFTTVDSGVGVDFFATIEEVLDNFVSNAVVEFMTNDALMQVVYQACHKMLLGGVVCSEENQYGAPQLMQAMLHQAKHCTAATGLFDPYLRQYVLLMLQALVDPNVTQASEKLRVWILTALFDAFYYNANATLQILVESNAYPTFFDRLFVTVGGARSVEAAGRGKQKASRGLKKSKGENDAAGLFEEMSILAKKVFVLGLTSILNVVTDPAHPLRASFHPAYTSSTLQVIVGCIQANEKRYTTRCRLAESNIAKVRSEALGEVEEEDAVDVDMDEDDILGLDGGDDLQSFESNNTREDGDDDDDYGGEGREDERDAVDDGDDYNSPIDDVCEVSYFLQWVRSGLSSAVLAEVGSLDVAPEQLMHAEKVAKRYRDLCVELEKAEEEAHQVRTLR